MMDRNFQWRRILPLPKSQRSKIQHKIMMVAGEVSGDMHAAKVIEALKKKDRGLQIFGLGGPLMARAGMEVREDLTSQAIMGFVEVVKHLPLSFRRMRDCERWLIEEKPDLLFLIDYPGFNLRLARKAKELGIPVCQYVAPQVWAWHESRIEQIKRNIDKLLVILPFEKLYFKGKGIGADYVGHPLLEEMRIPSTPRSALLKKNGLTPGHFPLIAAMPGSRRSEVEKIWPLYLEASRHLRKPYPDVTLIVPKPTGLAYEDYPGLRPDDSVFFVEAPAYDLRKICDLAWVKSGTSTLETALLQTPMVVVYKVAAITAYLAKRLLKIRYISLVNLLADENLVPELLQEKAAPLELSAETLSLLENIERRKAQVKGFLKIKKLIQKPSSASKNVALEIMGMLRNRP
jgi:lipid-A-disaccharide synthase